LIASRVAITAVAARQPRSNTPGQPFAARRSGRAHSGLPIRSASFVSILVGTPASGAGACPEADYFLWNDDFEFTAPAAPGPGRPALPASVVVHKTAPRSASTDADPGQRFFYEVRNKVWTLRARSSLPPARTRLLLRRFYRCPLGPHFAKSSDRGTLRSA